MPDFIDRLGAELLRAASAPELTLAPDAARSKLGMRVRLEGLSWRSRAAAIFAATAVVATPALAITQPWNPHPKQIVFRQGNHSGPAPTAAVSISTETPPARQLSLLGVLRRPATPRDHGPQVHRALGLLSGISGIELSYVRVLYDAPGQPLVLLFTAQRSDAPPMPSGRNSDSVKDPLCVDVVRGTGASLDSSLTCPPIGVLTSGHLIGSVNTFEYSVVPDGVATVIVRFDDGSTQKVRVHDNFVTFTAPKRGTSPGAPSLPISSQWRNSAGAIIKQTH